MKTIKLIWDITTFPFYIAFCGLSTLFALICIPFIFLRESIEERSIYKTVMSILLIIQNYLIISGIIKEL